MKIVTAQHLMDAFGNNIRETDLPEAQKATLGFVMARALLTPLPDEKLTGEQKHKLFTLAKRASHGATANFDGKEIAEIKRRIGLAFSIEVAGSAYEILETQGAVGDTESESVS